MNLYSSIRKLKIVFKLNEWQNYHKVSVFIRFWVFYEAYLGLKVNR